MGEWGRRRNEVGGRVGCGRSVEGGWVGDMSG